MEKEEIVKNPQVPQGIQNNTCKGWQNWRYTERATGSIMALSGSQQETLCLFKETASKGALPLVSTRPASERMACLVITSEKRAWGQGWLIR